MTSAGAAAGRDQATWPSLRRSPGHFLRLALGVFLRLFYGLFFFLAGLNKVLSEWNGAYVTEIFQQRLTELNPDSFASIYIENFAMHITRLIAFVVTWSEFAEGLGLLLGLITRWAAVLALFILINIAIGGYFDASLLPFFAINISLCIWPLGQKFGLDRFLYRRYPDSILFR